MSLSNYQLESIAKSLNIPLNNICMKDELPNKKVIGNYILNLESSNTGGGTHWCCIMVREKSSFYFDSFGSLPPLDVIQLCKSHNHLYFNNWIIQDLNSSLCGFYCIAMLNYITKYPQTPLLQSANEFINMFHDNTLDNGNILKDYLSNYKFGLNKYLLKSK